MKRLIEGILVLALLAGVGWGGYAVYWRVQQRRALSGAAGPSGPLKVAVVRVATATLADRTAVTGEIRAVQVVDVIPKVVGTLERLRLPDGTPLDVGVVIGPAEPGGTLPVIAVIEHEALAAAVAQAEASAQVTAAAVETARAAVASAEAAVKAADVTYADCKRERLRMERLVREGSGTSQQLDSAVALCDKAEAQHERAVANRAAATAGLAEARAGVAQAAAAVRQARVPLADATIRAAIAGVVTRKYVDEGNLVGPTTRLVQIAQVETVKIVGGVSERHLRHLAAGKTPAAVTVDAFPGETFDGVVHRVGEEADAATRTIDVEIRLPNPGRRLKPGMFARVQLVLERRVGVAVVPDAALLRDETGAHVYVLDGTTARRRRVTLGLGESGRYEVRDGVAPGERIVVRGQRQLADGQTVQPVEEGEP